MSDRALAMVVTASALMLMLDFDLDVLGLQQKARLLWQSLEEYVRILWETARQMNHNADFFQRGEVSSPASLGLTVICPRARFLSPICRKYRCHVPGFEGRAARMS